MSERKNTDAVCVCMCLRAFTGQAVGGDTWQRLSANVAEGRSGVRAGVPVVHPGEMLHIKLTGLGGVGRRNIEVETRQHFSTQEETQKDKNENFPGTTIKKNN